MVRFRRGFDDFCEDLRSRIGPHGEVLEPVMLQWADDFVVPGAQLDALAPEVYEADIVLIGASGLQQMPAVRIAERYAKPMVMMGQVAASDITAYLRARGMALAQDVARTPAENLALLKHATSAWYENMGLSASCASGADFDAMLHQGESFKTFFRTLQAEGMKAALAERAKRFG